MHCPNCAQPATADQQFCRSCGMSLETVAKLVAEHSSTPIEAQAKVDQLALERAITLSMYNWIKWGLILIGLGVFLAVLNKNLEVGKTLSILTSVVILSGVGVAAAGVLKSIKHETLLPAGQGKNKLSGSRDTKSLPTNPIPGSLPSVTERTTQLIGVEEAPTNKMMDRERRE